jgi:V/A-type H+-transporting ATPase subunit A
MVRNGFLQQSAFDPVDMFCAPVKQVRILELILAFHDRALAWLAGGGALASVLALGCRQDLVRLKATVANGDEAALDRAEAGVKTEFEALGRTGEGRPS